MRFQGARESGYSLIEAVLALGLSTVLIGSTLAILKSTDHARTNLTSMQALYETKYLIVANIKNDTAFNNTIAANPAMACLKTKTGCAGQPATLITLMTPNSPSAPLTGVGPAGNPSQGIRPDGETCFSFSASGSSGNCPFRFEVQWEPRCPTTGSCEYAESFFNIKLLYSPDAGTLRRVNTSTFTFTLARSDLKSDRQGALIDACLQASGVTTGSGSSLRCTLPYKGRACPPPQVIRGFNADTSPICGSLNGGVRWRCPAGGVLLGIDGFGQAICGAGCDGIGAGTATMMIN